MINFAKYSDILIQVKETLISNPLRSILSALGVVIGISFVIIMGYALNGLNLALEKTFNILGSDMLYVDKHSWSGGQNWKKTRQRKNISYKQTMKLRETLETAELVIPSARQWAGNIKYDGESYQGVVIQGVFHEYSKTAAGEIEKGRFFSPFEDKQGENVIVMGFNAYNTIFPKNDGLGKEIKIGGHKFRVIGQVKKRGVLFLDFIDNLCFIPLKTFRKVYGDYDRSYIAVVKAGNTEKLDEVRSELIGQMRVIRNLEPADENDFSINEMKAFEENVKTIRYAVLGIGTGMSALSFFVGIIGIINIMFVSVSERTSEIGIRKALGARQSSILLQVIAESIALCLVGAIISLALCSGIIYLASGIIISQVEVLDFIPRMIPLDFFLISAVLALVFGILAGIVPAYHAAKLDPVEALRQEK